MKKTNFPANVFVGKRLFLLSSVLILVAIFAFWHVTMSQPQAIPAQPATSTSQSVATTPTVPSRGGRGATNKPAPITIPASWPAEIPIPEGTLTGAAANATVINLIATGQYQDIVNAINSLYASHGFSRPSGSQLQFENARYKVTIVVENRDHSATSDNVVVSYIKK